MEEERVLLRDEIDKLHEHIDEMNTTITALQKSLQMNAKKLGFDEPEDFRESLRFKISKEVEENRKLKEQLEEKKARLEFELTLFSGTIYPPLQ